MYKVVVLLACLGGLQAAVSPQEALQKLTEGHQRFLTDKSLHPERTAERRLETADMQEPYAIIVGCSDSRVAPEIIFDQGIGELFIVRVAGNVVGPLELDSVEYAAVYLHAPLVLVLGHENCGAVQAVLSGKSEDIEAVAELIEPAVKKSKGMTGNALENAVKTNAKMVAAELKKSKALAKLIDKKKLAIRAGYYNFHTGEVEIFKE